MKKQAFVLSLAYALGLGLAGNVSAQAPAAPAAPAAAVKLGIINIQRAIIESNEGKKAAQKLQEQISPKRNDLQGRQAEIEKLQKQLREQEKTLSDEARGNLVRQVETKTKEFTRINEDYSNEAQQAEAQVINEIGQRVMKVLDEFARKNGYHVVLDVSSQQTPVLWAASSVDVTDEIIKLFNAVSPGASAGPAGNPPAAASGTPPAAKPPAAKPAITPGTPAAPAAKKPAAAPPR